MARFSPTAQDFVNLEKRMHEISKRVGNGTLDPKGAYDALQPIVEGRFPLVSDPFGNYTGMLLSLDQQLVLLREYNEKYWSGVITEDMFAAVNTASDHVQRFEDLEILYVQFGSDKETFENWVAVFKGEHPNFCRGDSLNEGYDIRRLGHNTRSYPVGIHRMHINLAAHWDPKKSTSVDDTLAEVKGSAENLAHGEVYAAYGLHTELFEQTDGTNLPWFDAAGYQVLASGEDEWRDAPYGYWFAGDRRASVYSYWAGVRDRGYARPVVWESAA